MWSVCPSCASLSVHGVALPAVYQRLKKGQCHKILKVTISSISNICSTCKDGSRTTRPIETRPIKTRTIKTRPTTTRLTTTCPTDSSPHGQPPHGQLAPRTTRPIDNSPHGKVLLGYSDGFHRQRDCITRTHIPCIYTIKKSENFHNFCTWNYIHFSFDVEACTVREMCV